MEKLSKARELDRQMRTNIMENIAVMLRMYQKTGKEKYLDTAKEWGIVSSKFAAKIASHDYFQEDEEFRIIDDLCRRAEQLLPMTATPYLSTILAANLL